jgi:predicted aspartyl protease
MIRGWLRAAAVTAAALAWSLPHTARALETVPFAFDDGTIRVQGTVNGRAIPMRIDLGAGIDVLSQSVGSRAVNVTSKFVTLDLTGQRVDLPVGNVVSIALGEFTVDSKKVGIWSGLDGSGVDGLISASAFRDITATFDFRQRQLLIEDAVSLPQRKQFTARVPLTLQDALNTSLGVFANFDFGNGQSALCAIDTGTRDIMIDRRFAAKLGVNLADPGLKHVRTPLGDGIAATIGSLSLMDDHRSVMQHPSVVFENLVYDCNVGTDFWADKIFTLDIPQRMMYVAPPA